MPNTTNYNWVTPADTDLVKDGAAAIRTLGSSIDSTLKTQIDNTVASSIQKTLTTTTGDVIYASGANTPARLGIGSTGQVLTVTGGVPTWATATSGSLTLLSTTTLSGATTTVSGISGSYTNLLVVVNGITNPSTNYTLRIAPNGVTNIVSATGIQQTSVLSTTNGQILPTFSQNITNTPADNGLAIIIYRYASSITNKPFTGSMGFNEATGGTNVASVISGAIRTTSAISSLVFTPSGGTFSAGTVLVYGVN